MGTSVSLNGNLDFVNNRILRIHVQTKIVVYISVHKMDVFCDCFVTYTPNIDHNNGNKRKISVYKFSFSYKSRLVVYKNPRTLAKIHPDMYKICNNCNKLSKDASIKIDSMSMIRQKM